MPLEVLGVVKDSGDLDCVVPSAIKQKVTRCLYAVSGYVVTAASQMIDSHPFSDLCTAR